MDLSNLKPAEGLNQNKKENRSWTGFGFGRNFYQRS